MSSADSAPVLSQLDAGIVAGLLIASGSFGGDGKQPQITLRMHVRHERLLTWLAECFPRTRLYGPYRHGERAYLQWMARGEALVLDVLPVLEGAGVADLDDHASARLSAMLDDYAGYIRRVQARPERLG
jgi:hypothetical protein